VARKRYSPKLKFQVVLEALTGEKTPGQIAKQYGIHPNSVGIWKKQFPWPAAGEDWSAGRGSSARTTRYRSTSGAWRTWSSSWAGKRWRSPC
jgi:transposase-like protein